MGWQRYKVFEDFNVNRCYNCNGYGHSAKKCKEKISCKFCAEEHDGKVCPDTSQKKCSCCAKANDKYKLNLNTNHYAFEENLCGTYKYFKNVSIANTSY